MLKSVVPSSEDCKRAVLLDFTAKPSSYTLIDLSGLSASARLTEYTIVPPFPSPGSVPINAPATVIQRSSVGCGSGLFGLSSLHDVNVDGTKNAPHNRNLRN